MKESHQHIQRKKGGGIYRARPAASPLNKSWSPGFVPESAYCQNVVKLKFLSIQITQSKRAKFTSNQPAAFLYWKSSVRSTGDCSCQRRHYFRCMWSTSRSWNKLLIAWSSVKTIIIIRDRKNHEPGNLENIYG
jgi:hypothetical protein